MWVTFCKGVVMGAGLPIHRAEPDVPTCRIGNSPLAFRAQSLGAGRPDCVVLGSGLSFGRFVAEPWPAILARLSGQRVVNLAVPQTSPEAWLRDEVLMALAVRAHRILIELPDCQRLSNRFFQVHPRRNDRVVQILPPLTALYPEADFMDYLFTGHLLRHLERLCHRRFALVREALEQAWSDRMSSLISELPGEVTLLRLSGPQETRLAPSEDRLRSLHQRARNICDLRWQSGGEPGPAAGLFPDAQSHEEIARQLLPILQSP